MAFPWLDPTPFPKDGADRRAKVACAELASRASLLFRLGFSAADATKRLCARVAWEFDPPSKAKHGPHTRPAALSDAAIGKIVAETYARRPS
jgi:hypothetical protein